MKQEDPAVVVDCSGLIIQLH